jgi:hypothetical protein
MAPAYARRDVRVCLVRDPSLSAFDPVAAALQSLAEVVVRERLPSPDDWDDCRGLVILARISTAAGMSMADIQAANGERLPPSAVLWLVSRADSTTTAPKGALVPMQWPLTLEQLAAFVQGL